MRCLSQFFHWHDYNRLPLHRLSDTIPAMELRRILAALLVFLGLLLTAPQRARADGIPERAYISGLKGYPQRFTLSCESRSAVDWAGFWGVSIREKRFLNELPRSDNPDAGFVGNPDAAWGEIPPRSYGVHAEPVAALLRKFGLQAEARTEMSWDDLRVEIAAGRPVIVWVVGQLWKGSPIRYKASDGQSTIVARFEHTMILIGYTPRSVTLVDAFSGSTQTYPIRTFMGSWGTLGRMAIVGQGAAPPAPAPEPERTPLPASFSHQQYLPLIFGPNPSQVVVSSAPPDTYRVQRGDYLTQVARRFSVDWQKLAALNGIQFPYAIYAGQVLRIR
jgi:uncharacterized protein YvpB